MQSVPFCQGAAHLILEIVSLEDWMLELFGSTVLFQQILGWNSDTFRSLYQLLAFVRKHYFKSVSVLYTEYRYHCLEEC